MRERTDIDVFFLKSTRAMGVTNRPWRFGSRLGPKLDRVSGRVLESFADTGCNSVEL